MSTQKEQDKPVVSGDEQRIADYLVSHADFFNRHPDLVESIKVPHRSGNAISLIERQLNALREKNTQLKRQLHDLINNARENDRLGEMLQKLTLLLLKTKNLDASLLVLAKHLSTQFPTDATCAVLYEEILPESTVRTLNAPVRAVSRRDAGWQELRLVLDRGTPLCGRFKNGQLGFLFGARADSLQSAALIPLHRLDKSGQSPFGIIAVANTDPARFQANMGTVFLTHMGQTISCALERYLPNG